MPKKINKRTLNKVKRRLPLGWKTTIAKEMNLQPDTVRKILDGTRYNFTVLEKAIVLSRLPEDEKDRLIQSLAS